MTSRQREGQQEVPDLHRLGDGMSSDEDGDDDSATKLSTVEHSSSCEPRDVMT